MRALSPEWLEKQTINLKMAACLREIGELKGRSEMVGTRALRSMELLRQVTAEHSAAAACRLERSETSVEQTNYQRLVLELQDTAAKLPVEAATVKLIHAGLFAGSGSESAGFGSTEAADAVAELCDGFRALEPSTEGLLLIGTFISEFLHVRPFASGNLRTALLIAVWLLNRSGYSACRYVSLERILERMDQEFRAAMTQAALDSRSSSFDIMPWWSCWLEVILISYGALSTRSEALSGRRGIKTNMVLTVIGLQQTDFSIRQLQQLAPECGIELIRKILKEQKAAGKLRCIGRGPNALWRKKKMRRTGIV